MSNGWHVPDDDKKITFVLSNVVVMYSIALFTPPIIIIKIIADITIQAIIIKIIVFIDNLKSRKLLTLLISSILLIPPILYIKTI